MRSSFRVAAHAPRWRHLLATLVQTLVMWGVFLGLMPWGLIVLEHHLAIPGFDAAWQVPVGIAGFVLCGSLGLWSGFTMAWHGEGTPLPTATARRLVVAGPYRFVRNPMAIAGLGQGAAVGIALGSWSVLIGVLAGLVIWQVWVRPAEEGDLETRFGDAYRHYRRLVGCWWPSRAYRAPPAQ
jgi:protein-S-isoprenylcysteine O-methyltransferase Ste14